MEDLMLGIGTNCMTAAVILWETTDLQWFPATLAITAAVAFLICARELVKKNDAEPVRQDHSSASKGVI
jgi:hypothetical protein|nr:MAG TPA: hypothetical protein [Caudoviricetes sp.]